MQNTVINTQQVVDLCASRWRKYHEGITNPFIGMMGTEIVNIVSEILGTETLTKSKVKKIEID